MTIEEYFKTQSISAEKNHKRKIVWRIMGILCLSVILFSLYTIFQWYIDHSKIRQINKEIQKNTNMDLNYESGELVNPPENKESNYYRYASLPFYQADFSFLLSKNKDTVAFIHINNTKVNYPVVQANDNSYYLNHSFDGSENKAGWVFMDYRNNINDLDDNIIIYGHSRIDGTMFGSLRNTLSSSWQDDPDNYVIFLSTLKENMIFQIFSIYTVERESYYITPNFSNNHEKQVWIDTMKKRNIASMDTEVNVKDKILTLSTCQNNQGGRIVIQAKLIKRQTI